jgi:hypothetical protein
LSEAYIQYLVEKGIVPLDGGPTRMPIIVRKTGGDFKPAPEGLHQAVCCDVWEPWVRESKFGKQEVIRIVWQLEETIKGDDGSDTGKRFQVNQVYTTKLGEKANLRKALESWRGRKFTEEELKGFDVEKLIGVNCQILIQHSDPTDDGTVFANVKTITPLGKGMEKMAITADYVRHKDRPENGTAQHAPAEAEAEECPF